MKVGGTHIEFGPRETTLPGMTFSGGFFKNIGTGIAL